MLVFNIRSFSYIHCACWRPFWFHFHSPPVLCIELLNEKMENRKVVYKNIKQTPAFRRAHCKRKLPEFLMLPCTLFSQVWCSTDKSQYSTADLSSVMLPGKLSLLGGCLFHLQIYNQSWVLWPKPHPSPIAACLFCDTWHGWRFIDNFVSI